MNTELLIVSAVAIALVVGITVGTTYLRKKNLVDSDSLSIIASLILIIEEVAITDEQAKSIADAVVDVVKYIQNLMDDYPTADKKAAAVQMLRTAIDAMDLEIAISDSVLENIVTITYTVLNIS